MSTRLEIHFPNVGGGDCAIIAIFEEKCNNKWILKYNLIVDAGENNSDILAYASHFGLLHEKSYFDYGILTHYHADHGNFPNGIIVKSALVPHPEFGIAPAPANGVKNLCVNGSTQLFRPSDIFGPSPLVLGEVTLDFVCGNGRGVAEGTRKLRGPKNVGDMIPVVNPASMGFLLTFGRFKFFSAGDMGWIENYLPNSVRDVHLFKASHHGSHRAGAYNDEKFVKNLNSRITYISAWPKFELPEVDFLNNSAKFDSDIFIGNSFNIMYPTEILEGFMKNLRDRKSVV